MNGVVLVFPTRVKDLPSSPTVRHLSDKMDDKQKSNVYVNTVEKNKQCIQKTRQRTYLLLL